MAQGSQIERVSKLFAIVASVGGAGLFLVSRFEDTRPAVIACTFLGVGVIYLLTRWKYGPWRANGSPRPRNAELERGMYVAHIALIFLLVLPPVALLSVSEGLKRAPTWLRTGATELVSGKSADPNAPVVTGQLHTFPFSAAHIVVIGNAEKATTSIRVFPLDPLVESFLRELMRGAADVCLQLLLLTLVVIGALRVLEIFSAKL